MLLQWNDPFSFDISEMLNPILSIIVLLILMIIMVFLYVKHRIFLPILTVFLFSVIFGIMSLDIQGIPFTPWFQTFFIVFQMIFLLTTSIQVFKNSW